MLFILRQIFLNKVKPHAFSWFIWGMLTGIAFVAQVVKSGGAGAWVTGLTSVSCFIICAVALFKGKREFVPWDWFFLIAALVAILVWWFTKEPTLSVILVTTADAFGFFPTYRKSYYHPYEEGATLFTLSTIKWIPAIFALTSFSLATWLYPASLVLTNGLIVIIILVRRKQLQKIK